MGQGQHTGRHTRAAACATCLTARACAEYVSHEEFTRLAETRLAQNTLYYIKLC